MLPELKIIIGAETDKAIESLDKLEKKFASMKKVTDKMGAGLVKFGDKISGLGRKASVVSVGVAAIGAAAFTVASGTAAAGNAIDKQSKAVGLSATSFQELGFAIGQVSDMTGDQFSNALRQMNTRIGQAADGNKTMQDSLVKLGFSMDDIESGAVSSEAAFMALATAARDTKTPAEAAALAAGLMGEEAAKLGPILRESGGDIQDLRDKAQSLGIVLSDDAVSAAAGFTDKMDELSRQTQALRDKIGSALLPVLTNQLLPAIQDKIIPGIVSLVEGIASAIEWFGNLPGPVQEAVGVIATAFAVGGPILLAIGAFTKVIGGLLLATGPIGLLIGAAVLLTTAWFKWGDDIKELLGNVKSWFVDGFNSAIEWIESLPDRFIEMGANIIEGFKQGIITKFEEVKEGLLAPFKDFKEGIADFFGIASPSKLFHQFGLWIGEGFANGVNESSSMLETAIGVLGGGAQKKMAGAASSILGSMSQVFKGSKPLAIAQALINTWLGATEALKLPFPANIAAFSSTLATGMSAVNSIKSTTSSGSGGGGAGGAGGGAAAAAVQQPLQISLSGISPTDLFSGQQVKDLLFDEFQDMAGDRGLSFAR